MATNEIVAYIYEHRQSEEELAVVEGYIVAALDKFMRHFAGDTVYAMDLAYDDLRELYLACAIVWTLKMIPDNLHYQFTRAESCAADEIILRRETYLKGAFANG